MKKIRLGKLNSLHEATLTAVANDLLKKTPAEKTSSAKAPKEKTSQKWQKETICQKIDEDLSSALLVDDIFIPAADKASVFRNTIVAVWNEGDWKINFQNVSRIKSGENNSCLEDQNRELNKYVSSLSSSLSESREALKKLQGQVLHQEKLASLGQLSAGIAHEIKNPLNFINNFSELSTEYIEEVFENLESSSTDSVSKETENLLRDVQVNLKKIHEHSSRVERIVRSMLMHSRGESGSKEVTDLNVLIREYVNLAFHGMRANRNPINVNIQFNLDPSLKEVKLNPEDFSRVILNLCNNAFDAMREKYMLQADQVKLAKAGNYKGQTLEEVRYLPRLIVSTLQKEDSVTISIEDNGPGVPKEIKDKLMMPFFTTKKSKEGTGLGLSITKGIIKDHNGRINLSTKENEFTRFTISLPLKRL
ncbi:sensor histidine kinase [Salinimicrobium soli]|uniref:sensor histidine kinase n=1 Tax=Salinimicrobium soli TaxID=1254399 RepID=UPI003AAF6FD0